MGSRKCCIDGCTSQEGLEKDNAVTFHRFPNNSQQCTNWIKASRFESSFKPSKSSYVCSRHFKRENFTSQSNGKIVLKSNSTPSIFPWNKDEILAAKKASSSTETKSEVPRPVEVKIEKTETPVKPAETKKKVEPKKIPTPAPKADENVKKSKRLSEKLSAVKPSPTPKPKVVEEKKEKKPVVTEPTTSTDIIVDDELSKDKARSTINFVPGSSIEAQNFDGKWMSVKVVEIDMEEREVLVRSCDKNSKIKTGSGINDEWISMDSPRLRPAQPVQTFEVGEKVLARWNDCRKFPATIKRVLENDTYDVLFDDGYPKIVRGVHINKFNPKNVPKVTAEPAVQQPINPLLLNPPALIPDYIKAMKDLPSAPTEGLWCCAWVDDIPIGEESAFDGPHGKLPSIVVPDWRVKEGWQKHIYLRQNGKWDVLFISPTNRKLRFKNELKTYLLEIGETYDPETWDFSLHKKRSKLEGLCITTDKLKTQKLMNDGNDALANPFASLGALPYIQQNLVIPITTTTEVRVGALKVKVVDNIYQCPQESCDKTFRKENHLQLHIKHYHDDLAKLMGDCPNMEDLAYLRTTTDEPEVTPTKQVRRSHGPKSRRDDLHIKTEIVSPDSRYQRSPILEEALKSPIIASLLRTSPVKSEMKEHGVKRDSSHLPGFDPETLIPPHAVSRHPLTKANKRKAKFGKRLSANKKRRIGGSYPYGMPEKKVFSSIPGIIPYNEGPYFKSQQSGNFVDENGEVIKIVRMKKEEIINCVCGFGEEDGLMVQCEMCLCWQHGLCNLIEKPHQVPDNYVCFICKNPLRQRKSQKYLNYQEWLYDGKLSIASYHTPNPKQTSRFETLKTCHTLTGNLLEMKRFMNSLDVKINIAEKQNHPKLYLWAKKWETTVKKEEKNETINELNDGDVQMMMPMVPEPELAIEPAKCQQTILDHIQYQQQSVRTRLDQFDDEITALEESEKSSTVDETKLKQTIYMLLGDLAKMNKIATIHKA